MPELSVVIPAYQSEATVGACVHALLDQSVPRERYEVIVVDDGSQDQTAEEARNAGADKVLVIKHSGASGARNAGFEVATGDLVLFTDADCEPGPQWIERMIAPLDDPRIMGGKGVYRTRQKSLIAQLVQLEFEIRYERMRDAACIDFVDTYSAIYRRTLFEDLGGFTVGLFPVEDIDLSFRFAQAGHCLVFIPDAWVYHIHPDKLYKYLKRKAHYGFWRAALYLRYPDKISGDTHTDPTLKSQFLLTALSGLFAFIALFIPYMWILAVLAFLAFICTTLRFVRWAWSRNRQVALIWPFVNYLRVWSQGVGLGLGFVYNIVIKRK